MQMTLRETIRSWLRLLYFLGQNPVSFIGAVLTTSGAITLIAFWFYDFLLPGPPHPYIGILLFLILPGVFVCGLLLIPIGIALQTWKRRKKGDYGPFLPQGGELRKLAIFVGLTTMVNLLMGSQFSYRAVTYMDTDSFCGKSCHTVMNPEYTAYSHSPHARVACAECHIGPGASFFVKS